MNGSLTLICWACGQPIEDDTGALRVTYSAIREHQQLAAAWNSQHGPGPISGAELMLYPDGVHWRAYHDSCDPAWDEDSYQIDASQLHTLRDLVHWTAHLMSKNWFAATDWDSLLREAAGEVPATTIRVLERAA